MQSDSDGALDNAKHEVEFCINQLGELAPEIMKIAQKELTSDNAIDQFFNKVASIEWEKRYKNAVIKVAGAQAKYIRLLEKRIGK
jgi:hypothetical protein